MMHLHIMLNTYWTPLRSSVDLCEITEIKLFGYVILSYGMCNHLEPVGNGVLRVRELKRHVYHQEQAENQLSVFNLSNLFAVSFCLKLFRTIF